MVKNGQPQHKDRPHTQEKSQDAATSVEDAIIILRGLNLCDAHCTCACISQPSTYSFRDDCCSDLSFQSHSIGHIYLEKQEVAHAAGFV
jgi:hypothetical protein